MSKLKKITTQKDLLVEAKFLPTFTVPDCINYYYTSQHCDAFFLEDTDRRFFIHEVEGGPADMSMYQLYDKWMKGSGPSALFEHLLQLDLGSFDPNAPALGTRAKEAMISDTKSDLGLWVSRLRQDPKGTLGTAYGDSIAAECDLFTAAQLFQAYDPAGDKVRSPRAPTLNALGRTLKASGFRQVNLGQIVWTGAGPQKLYAIRNSELWQVATLESIRSHWNYFFGGAK